MFCRVCLDKNVGDRPPADVMRNASDCQNVDSLTLCLQLLYKIIECRNTKLLKESMT